jgi:hypothetical protein
VALVTLGGAGVERGRIALGLSGAWTAQLVLDTPTPPSGPATIAAAGGLELHGTVVPSRSGARLDSSHVWVVGGAGGLATEVGGAFRSAQLRDPLNAILAASGEKLSSTTTSQVLSVSLPFWTLGVHRAGRALDELAAEAGRVLGKVIRWRVLSDGTIWLGAETWPTAKLPADADVLDTDPSRRQVTIGPATPALLPGVDLDGVGRVLAVEHHLQPDQVRSLAWI